MKIDITEITQIKLAELKRQREILSKHYQSLETETQQQPDKLSKLRVLYEGLKELTFANKALHPNLPSMETFFDEVEWGTASDELLKSWMQRLETERRQGKRCTDFAYLFSELVQEWVANPSLPRKPKDELLEIYIKNIQSTSPPIDWDALEPIFEQESEKAKIRQEHIEHFLNKVDKQTISDDELRFAISELAQSHEQDEDLRKQLSTLLHEKMLRNELLGALNITNQNRATWSWSRASKVEMRFISEKWRPFFDTALFDQVFLQVIGYRWLRFFEHLLSKELLFQSKRPSKYQSISLNGTRKHRKNSRHFVSCTSTGYHKSGGTNPFRDEANHLQILLTELHGELHLRHTLFPERPIWALNTDIKQFFSNISHELILGLLQRLGFPKESTKFIQSFLQIPTQAAETSWMTTRGVPLGFVFSHMFGGILMMALEKFVTLKTKQDALERITSTAHFGLLDDLYWITDSQQRTLDIWQTVHLFCSHTGLEVNLQKSGCTGLWTEEDKLEGLPSDLCKHGYLMLSPQGHWQSDKQAIEAFRAELESLFKQDLPLLLLANTYNQKMGYLHQQLGHLLGITDEHTKNIMTDIVSIHQNLSQGKSIVQVLRDAIQERFSLSQQEVLELPDAWFYWPVTAGGLGLGHFPLLMSTIKNSSLESVKVPSLSTEVEPREKADYKKFFEDESFSEEKLEYFRLHTSYELGSYYQSILHPRDAKRPTDSTRLKEMVQKFKKRSSEVSGSSINELTFYWQWILNTYAPDLLDRFGSFSFLNTELVPLHFFFEQRGGTKLPSCYAPHFSFHPARQNNSYGGYSGYKLSDEDIPF